MYWQIASVRLNIDQKKDTLILIMEESDSFVRLYLLFNIPVGDFPLNSHT